jgi:hypothetical protein
MTVRAVLQSDQRAPTSDRSCRALPDEHTLQATVVALGEHGFSVEVVDDLDAARKAAVARIPEGLSVMTNASVTLAETGIADAINDGGLYDSSTRLISHAWGAANVIVVVAAQQLVLLRAAALARSPTGTRRWLMARSAMPEDGPSALAPLDEKADHE